ncbi:DMT family transporter [Pseudaquabacterium rugosum]|jgi:drug/metabolite transporter (DMT)-like permease|uniref:DMT family transporter n=1 Tax=Pseudaquabacterium rugosum TaxID=2984194 RepID=A0ABU9B748_9BURK
MSMTPRLALLMTIPPLLWAGNAVIGRLAVQAMPALWLNAARWAIALALLAPLGWRAVGTREARARIGERWPHLALLSLTGVGAYNALQYMALRTSTPLNATLISASSPVVALAIGAFFYGERPRLMQLAGAGLSLLGVALVLGRGDLTALARLHLVTGDLYMIAATLSWSVYSWLLARPPASMRGGERPPWDWAQFLWVQMLLGLGWATLAAGTADVVSPTPPVQWSPLLLLALAYIAIGPSLIAYRLWGLGVAQAGPAMAAFFINLIPLFAALLSAALLGEWPQPFHGLAFALIVGGIVVSSRRPAPARA